MGRSGSGEGLSRRRRMIFPHLASVPVLLLLVDLLPGAAAHGFAGFEVSGIQMLEPAGSVNSSFTMSKHGEPAWRFEISFSASRESGNGSRPAIDIAVVHAASVVSKFHGPAGALTVPTEDRLDYWINWTNPTTDRLELRFRVAFLGPPTPIELSLILALGAAVLTLIVVVLFIDGLHAVGKAEKQREQEGYATAEELARSRSENAGDEVGLPGGGQTETGPEKERGGS